MAALTTIESFLTTTQVTIPELESETESVRNKAVAYLNDIINTSSDYVTEKIRYNPVDDNTDVIRNFRLTASTNTVSLPYVLRSLTAFAVGGQGVMDDVTIRAKKENELSLPSPLRQGTIFQVEGIFGLGTSADTMSLNARGNRIRRATNGVVWNTLFKEGVIRDRNIGSDSSTYFGGSWLTLNALNKELYELSLYVNCEEI